MDDQQDLVRHDTTDFLYVCDICGQADLNNLEMKMHMATSHTDDVICLFCDLKGVTPDEMTLHINSVHFGDMSENRNMELEQNYNGYMLMKRNDYVFSDTNDPVDFHKEGEMKMSTSELNIKAADIEESVDSGVNSNKCSSCKEEGTTSKVEDNKLGVVVSNTSSFLSFIGNTAQLIDPNIHAQRLLDNQSNLTHETQMESSFLCPFCDFVTDDENAIERHFNVDHSDQCSAQKVSKDNFESDHGHEKTPFLCPICELNFHEYSFLHHHVNEHFREDLQTNECAEKMTNMHTMQAENRVHMSEHSQHPEADQTALNCHVMPNCSMPTSEKVANENCKSGKLVACSPSSSDSDDRSSSTEGVIQKLLSHYNNNHDIKQFWLCSNVDHYSAGADRGWGCGYRNFQMLLSSLTKCSVYKADVFQGLSAIPSLQKIQSLVEDAWRRGFDQLGSIHFQGTVLNTKKWIGATEVVTVLSSLQIRCNLVDFHTPTGSNNTHPLLFEWIKHYFQTPEPFKLPLYFQHQGHSRTIIGMEEHRDGSLKLLAFDPGVPQATMKKYLRMDNTTHLLKCLRKSATDLKHKQYQIVAVCGIMDKSEMKEYKILKSTRIP